MDEFKNQARIFDVDKFDYLKIAIVGVGTIGSFCTLALSKIGFKNLIVIDDDKVEKHNIATQFYFKGDLDNQKVSALRSRIPDLTCYNSKLKANNFINADVVFICVDSLKQRKIILNSVLKSNHKNKKPILIIDGRMHRLMFRVFTINLSDAKILKSYTKGLLSKEFKGSCNEKGIIQNVFAVTSVMVEQLKKVINNEDYYSAINCDFENYQFNNQVLIKQS